MPADVDGDVDAEVAPIYRDDPALKGLIGPGGPFEVELIELNGVPLRSFVRAPRTIIDCFQASRSHDALVHLVFEEERLTFGEMRQEALSLARELRAAFGVVKGDRVALAMRNFPEFILGFWGATILGAIVVPLNAWWTGPELNYAVMDAGARVVIADEERLLRMEEGRDDIEVPALIAVRTDDAERYRAVAIDSLTAGKALAEVDYAVTEPDDPVTILYTSGTTGYPKGALGTNRGAIANLMNMAFMAARDAARTGQPVRPLTRQAASIAAAPLFHIGGIAAIVGGAMSGSKMVLMRKWSIEEGLALAQTEAVTGFGGVPAIARQILNHPGVENLGLDIRSFPMGGAAVPPDLPKRAIACFGESLQILNGYGLTETTSAVVINFGSEYISHIESVGRPNLTADLRIEDEHGATLGLNKVGELCVRSPQNAKGYWNRPEETRSSFRDGGWFHSGDLGYMDRDGFVYVVDRLKDVVIRGGENVYCAEVEAVLFEHPGVSDVAVVGLPDEQLGERVCAIVVLQPGSQVSLQELRTFCQGHLGAFKCPEAMYVIDEVPRTPTSKTDKRKLRTILIDDDGEVARCW